MTNKTKETKETKQTIIKQKCFYCKEVHNGECPCEIRRKKDVKSGKIKQEFISVRLSL